MKRLSIILVLFFVFLAQNSFATITGAEWCTGSVVQITNADSKIVFILKISETRSEKFVFDYSAIQGKFYYSLLLTAYETGENVILWSNGTEIEYNGPTSKGYYFSGLTLYKESFNF